MVCLLYYSYSLLESCCVLKLDTLYYGTLNNVNFIDCYLLHFLLQILKKKL